MDYNLGFCFFRKRNSSLDGVGLGTVMTPWSLRAFWLNDPLIFFFYDVLILSQLDRSS
jgi:hypothetical protein